MQTVTATYRALWEDPRWITEHRAVISGEIYTQSVNLMSAPKVVGSLWGTGSPKVGCCVSRQIDLMVMPMGVIPRMAEIRLETRLVLKNPLTEEITLASEWVPKGTFYIDTRKEDSVTGALRIHGYDAMLKAESKYINDGTSTEEWPQSMTDVVHSIAQRLGVTVDPRSEIDPTLTIGYPLDYTMREILGYIAAVHGANWTITEAGALRLVALGGGDGVLDLDVNMASLDLAPAFDPISRVTIFLDEETVYTAGDDTGRELAATCPWATQDMADALLEKVRGFVYQPYTAQNALLDPAAELGDIVILNSVPSLLVSATTVFDAVCAAEIEAPAEEEIDHEYPYESSANREITRKIAQTRAEIKQTVNSITLTVTNDEDGTSSKFELKSGDVVLSSGNITFDGFVTFKGLEAGTTTIDGGCIKTGTVMADLVNAGVLQSEDGKTFVLDLDNGTFSMQGTGKFMNSDGSSYIEVDDDSFVLYTVGDTAGEYVEKVRIGFVSSGSTDYPYIQLGAGLTGSASAGLVKKFTDGLFIGNGAAKSATGAFVPQASYAGIFINTNTGTTYVVSGTNMKSIYTGAAIAKFA